MADLSKIRQARTEHAEIIAQAGGIEAAISSGALPPRVDTTLAEAVILGLLRQEVRTFVTVFGHGSTEVGEVLRIYERAGVVRTFGVRSEIEASHAACALRWVTGEKAAVVTSIGPGALQALAASLAPACDGIGVWYLFGDETTEDEGPNMQQVPKPEQHLFQRIGSLLGAAYSLHTPAALGSALRRGLVAVDDPHRGGPFYLLLPLNMQPAPMAALALAELPAGSVPSIGAAPDGPVYDEAVRILRGAERVVVKCGGGARGAAAELRRLLELADGVAVLSPLVTGLLAYDDARNMLVGGSKGTIPGNFAMESADVLVALGTRAVCQSDCSRTGYPNVRHVINVNTDAHAALHYGRTIALVGDVARTLSHLCSKLEVSGPRATLPSAWFQACQEKRAEWVAFKQQRREVPRLYDSVWAREVLTQPAAIDIASAWARANDAVTFFDAGDVQANGFQIVEDDRLGRTFTETGASYMGWASCALLATALASRPFYGVAITGDGSFVMSPQILFDGVAHGAKGCVLLLDNRRMGAISGLQIAQYGVAHATSDGVRVEYSRLASSVRGVLGLDGGDSGESLRDALDRARAHDGLSLIHVPVYFGDDPLGGMGVYGRWNVGPWVDEVQALRHRIAL